MFLFVVVFLAFSHRAVAHDIPADATVQAFVKPAGDRLQLLVRVPLKTMRDLDFQESERGYLDLVKLAPLLPDAARLWISDFIDVDEGDMRLPKPRLAAIQVSLPSDRSFASYDEALAHVTGPKFGNAANVVYPGNVRRAV